MLRYGFRRVSGGLILSTINTVDSQKQISGLASDLIVAFATGFAFLGTGELNPVSIVGGAID